ncbi:hypothetical protein [Maribacter hydrothermalis]|uniref:Selenophosphate synthetase n=1 Tax=Maribacter hydrothermalis TaxID=1836467 RepID=A0A1B7Z6Y6_9FLAO|nr:hypothetical protein [Maribacter hydrothermalis]APQ16496.1 hypothetical protein BTR34_03740 [Maribacter hydrothermalis]OBR38310.1 hypothetical protein A9200_17960 [Maribacter hydrothermalis]
MKKIIVLSIILSSILTACKTDNNKVKTEVAEDTQLTVLEKIANANGFAHWKDVASIKFTFNVDRDSTHFERTWLWETASNEVTMMTRQDTITFNRKAVDSTMTATDGGFVNDKFWLLAPFQLVWDQKNFTYKHKENTEAPISKTKMHKLTTVYGNDGGYTPGDAYDYYFGDDYIIKEWAYRKENQEEPNMVTSWEDYKTLNKLNISMMHKRPDADFSLYFTEVEVK